ILKNIQDNFFSEENFMKLNNGIVLFIIISTLLLNVPVEQKMIQFIEKKTKIKQQTQNIYNILLSDISFEYVEFIEYKSDKGEGDNIKHLYKFCYFVYLKYLILNDHGYDYFNTLTYQRNTFLDTLYTKLGWTLSNLKTTKQHLVGVKNN